MAKSPIWVLVPGGGRPITAEAHNALNELGVRVIPFGIEEGPLKFPLAAKVYAAAAAESLAQAQGSGMLAWLDSDNIVIQEPEEFLLPEGKTLGYRPVMLKNISSAYGEPVDTFWDLVYQGCGAKAAQAFSMTTAVDNVRIRAQFNAGLLVVRPQRSLLRSWRDNFGKLYLQDGFQPFYQQNHLYAIFVHQAVLAATILARMERSEMIEFSDRYNYPLMLIGQMPRERRAQVLDDLTTLRYDEFQAEPDWLDGQAMGKKLRGWLEANFSKALW